MNKRHNKHASVFETRSEDFKAKINEAQNYEKKFEERLITTVFLMATGGLVLIASAILSADISFSLKRLLSYSFLTFLFSLVLLLCGLVGFIQRFALEKEMFISENNAQAFRIAIQKTEFEARKHGADLDRDALRLLGQQKHQEEEYLLAAKATERKMNFWQKIGFYSALLAVLMMLLGTLIPVLSVLLYDYF